MQNKPLASHITLKPCSRCEGTGELISPAPTFEEPCLTCNSSGWVAKLPDIPSWFYSQSEWESLTLIL